jgi:hypothetical protein
MSDKVKQPPKKWSEMTKKEKRTNLIVLAVIVIILISIFNSVANANKSSTSSASPAQPAAKTAATPTPAPVAKVATRQITGKLTTLGSGTFTGGKDIPNGLYDATPGSGQSGNFSTTGTDSYNEILGGSSSLGVSKARVTISSGDAISISGLSQVTFTPVTSPFVNTYQLTSLYAGSFAVGQDIAAGRYIVTPVAGGSGNFSVTGADSYNEILGGSSAMGGVPSLTVNIKDGDTINISSLNQATFTPSS